MHIGLEIAEEIGAVMDNCSSKCHGSAIMVIQEAGQPGCNPIADHQRLLSS